MNRRTVFAFAMLTLLVGAVAVVTVLQPSDPLGVVPPRTAASGQLDRVARGGYIVKTAACVDCHVPWKMFEDGPRPDLSRGLSGHPEGFVVKSPAPGQPFPWGMSASVTNTAWSGPWGVSFTANLTPDKETGIGSWTPEMFRTAIRTGRHMGRGRPILPPMPWPVYRNLTDDDLDAVFAFLQGQPPVRNRVPEPLPPAAAPAPAADPAKPTPN